MGQPRRARRGAGPGGTRDAPGWRCRPSWPRRVGAGCASPKVRRGGGMVAISRSPRNARSCGCGEIALGSPALAPPGAAPSSRRIQPGWGGWGGCPRTRRRLCHPGPRHGGRGRMPSPQPMAGAQEPLVTPEPALLSPPGQMAVVMQLSHLASSSFRVKQQHWREWWMPHLGLSQRCCDAKALLGRQGRAAAGDLALWSGWTRAAMSLRASAVAADS